jgi:hypothetical protein
MCCGGACTDTSSDLNNCGGCGGKCGEGLKCCGGTCMDFLMDPQNCGSCGNVCSGWTPAAKAGTQPGVTCCGGQCTDTNWDRNNCGRCGISCFLPWCILGQCTGIQIGGFGD